MPYRRLPNTDNMRRKSLNQAVEEDSKLPFNERVISMETMEIARSFLPVFEKAEKEYKSTFQIQVQANKSFQELLKNAKIYISHFIQVLNLCIIRKEIKAEQKELYNLDVNSYSVPEMLSDASILLWGEKIINGEKKRVSNGGSPIYNPPIAKVQVHYDLFKTAYYQQKIRQKNTTRTLENLSSLRIKADEIIYDIWNQVEEKYNNLNLSERLENCMRYGIVYYYRKNEKKQDEIN